MPDSTENVPIALAEPSAQTGRKPSARPARPVSKPSQMAIPCSTSVSSSILIAAAATGPSMRRSILLPSSDNNVRCTATSLSSAIERNAVSIQGRRSPPLKASHAAGNVVRQVEAAAVEVALGERPARINAFAP